MRSSASRSTRCSPSGSARFLGLGAFAEQETERRSVLGWIRDLF